MGRATRQRLRDEISRRFPEDEPILQFLTMRLDEEGLVDLLSTFNSTNRKWEDDSIQFPRLLAEINAVGLSEEQMAGLRDSMELTDEKIDELMDRAEETWTIHKESL